MKPIRPKVLIITSNPLNNGPRLIREIDVLKKDFTITAVGSTPPHDGSIEYIPYNHIKENVVDRIVRKFFRIFNNRSIDKLPFVHLSIQKLLERVNPDIVIIHTPIHLPYFIRNNAGRYKVVYNAHEYHPLEFENDIDWMRLYGRLYHTIYKRYLHRCDLVVNVCDGIAAKCLAEFGVQSIVVPNACEFHDLKPIIGDCKPIRVIHHGVAVRERCIEMMIHALGKQGSDFAFDLMLVPTDEKYYAELQGGARLYPNVKLIEPVAFNEIVGFINKYDIGVFTLPPINFNYLHALPNKLFEFIQARLAIIVSPSPEMALIVEEHNLGWVTDNFTEESLIQTLKKVDKQSVERYKSNTAAAAEKLSAESYQATFLLEVRRLLNAQPE